MAYDPMGDVRNEHVREIRGFDALRTESVHGSPPDGILEALIAKGLEPAHAAAVVDELATAPATQEAILMLLATE